MSKVVLTTPASFVSDASAVAQETQNNQALVAAIENTLSRDGTAPNAMAADLDMNSHRILNLPPPGSGLEPVRLIDITSATTVDSAMAKVNNLSDVASLSQARINLSVNNVDNTSDVNKPVSTSQQLALNGKLTAALNLADVNAASARTNLGLGNVDNTSDVNKPVSTAQAAAIAAVGGVINIKSYGGVGDGVTNNDAAFTAAWAALGTRGGCIYFPAGKYVFNSPISKTLPTSQYSIMIKGDGSNSTILHWPNAGGGITLTQGIEQNTFHLRELTLTTSQVNSGTAFHVIGLGADNGSYWQSDIINVVIAGDDIGLGIPTLHYWGVCIYNHAWPSVYIANTNTWGPHQMPGGAGGGTGLIYEGDTPTGQYNALLNVVASSFNNHVNGWILGNYWQGVTCYACNFNGQLGNSAITANGTAGIQVLLEIIGCQFDAGSGAAIILASAVDNVTIIGNSIGVLKNNGIGVSVAAGQTFMLTNNIFAPGGSLTGTFGLVYGGSTCIVQGNAFRNLSAGVNLTASSSTVSVSQNLYPGVSTQVINNGTGNSVGVLTK